VEGANVLLEALIKRANKPNPHSQALSILNAFSRASLFIGFVAALRSFAHLVAAGNDMKTPKCKHHVKIEGERSTELARQGYHSFPTLFSSCLMVGSIDFASSAHWRTFDGSLPRYGIALRITGLCRLSVFIWILLIDCRANSIYKILLGSVYRVHYWRSLLYFEAFGELGALDIGSLENALV